METRKGLISIEKASLVRKFTVLFIVMSLLPFLIITYLFVTRGAGDTIRIGREALVALLFLTGFGSLAGFWGMRTSIMKIQEIARRANDTLRKELPERGAVETEENELTQLARAFNEVTKNLEDNIKRLESSKHTVQYVLSRIAAGVSSLQNIDMFLDLIVEIMVNALEAKTGVLMLVDAKDEELYVKSASGLKDKFNNLRIRIGEEGPGWVAKHKRPLLIPRLPKMIAGENGSGPFEPPLLCAPLLYQERLVGVLAVTGKLRGDSFYEDELLIVSNLASQTAIAVENERLNRDVEKTYLETISALAIAVEARDAYSRGHLDRVAQFAVKTAHKMGLSDIIIRDIRSAAELHDIGKIGINDEILKKQGVLNGDEAQIMQKHPIIGEAIIKQVRSLSSLCDIVRHHHEWLDGTGYPDGLKGDEISIGAKILCVADSFDAMTTDRPYRKALSAQEAKAEINKYTGIHYDAKVVEVFFSTLV